VRPKVRVSVKALTTLLIASNLDQWTTFHRVLRVC
jgi:hypothetical protein